MFSLGDSEIYYLSRTATDMRKGSMRCAGRFVAVWAVIR